MIEPEALLLLPRLHVQSANAISSPLTWGFPAPSAFCGFVHALHRQLASEMEAHLDGVAVVCHRMEPQASRPAGKRTHVFHLSRNPVGKDGGSAALLEDGRAHLVVSLVIGISGEALHDGSHERQDIAERAYELAMAMRLAGGSIVPRTSVLSKRNAPEILEWASGESEQQSRKVARKVLPGFALVSREQRLADHWEAMKSGGQLESTALDALLDLTRLNIDPPAQKDDPDDEDDGLAKTVGESERKKPEWTVRREPGWLVPIPAGYSAISELNEPGVVKNTRDRTTSFRFVESLFTLGQWLSPHRVDDITQLMWQYQFDSTNKTYRCTTPHYARKSKKEDNNG